MEIIAGWGKIVYVATRRFVPHTQYTGLKARFRLIIDRSNAIGNVGKRIFFLLFRSRGMIGIPT